MNLCSIVLASVISLVSIQEFSLRTSDQTICVTGGAADQTCYARPEKLSGEFDLRAALQNFDDVYDDKYQIKNDRERFAFSSAEQFAAIKRRAAGGGLTTAQRRHALATYAQIRVDQIGFDREGARPLTRDDGARIFEIPFVARLTLARTNGAAATIHLRGRLELPPDIKTDLRAKSMVDQAGVNARLAGLVELDGQSTADVDPEDLRTEIFPAALAQFIVELTLP